MVLANPTSATPPDSSRIGMQVPENISPLAVTHLREALMSAYFAIGFGTVAIILFAAAFLLFHRSDHSPRPGA